MGIAARRPRKCIKNERVIGSGDKLRRLKEDAARDLARAAWRNLLPVLAVVVALYFLGSTIRATYISFSPVPVVDSWISMVDFYVRSFDDASVWWVQHNEHRIFFSKLLFWLDMHFFDGGGQLLVPVNILLLLSIWGVACGYVDRLLPASSPAERVVVCAILALPCLSWTQSQNIIFSFQSMFILVFLLPLLSFYCYAHALENPPHAARWRLLSLALGAAATQCMANGIFALPALAVLSWLTERSPRRVGIIVLWAAASALLFLVDYQRSTASTLGLAVLLEAPWQIVKFAFAYLGNPVYAIFGRDDVSVLAGAVAVALAAFLFATRSAYRSQPYALALFAYLGYVFATAGLTATGRLAFGASFAASGRYLTPALTVWAVLLILLLARSRRVAPWSAVALVAVTALLLPAQAKTSRIDVSNMGSPHTKAVAALSLQLGIDDINQKRALALFYTEEIEQIFQRARRAGVSIFADRYTYLARQFGRPLADVDGETCIGAITFQQQVDEAHAAYRIGGDLKGPNRRRFRYVLFGDAQGIVKGVAYARRDIPGPLGPAGRAYFDGYFIGAPDTSAMRCIR